MLKDLRPTLSSHSARSEAGDTHTESVTDCNTIAGSQHQVIHAIVIPNYKEEVDTLRETLDVLASHSCARTNYDVYLAMEEREKEADIKAMSLIAEFNNKFRSIDFTLHPADMPNECPGKGSNVDWAARKLSERYPIDYRKNVIITGIDADSHLSSNFFSLLTRMHLAYPETSGTTLYSAPIIFDRNAHSVPAIVRVADILWCAAGISGLYRGSTIAPPTSVYSLSLQLVDRVGGWDCGSEAIGEDLHMYIKCFFALNGHLTVRTVLSPVSQTNVTAGGHGKGISGIVSDMRARYKQALRHMWGALDTGFAIRKLVELWHNRKQTTRTFRPLHTAPNGSANMDIPKVQLDALVSGTDTTFDKGLLSDETREDIKGPNYRRLLVLIHRLFEAHFLPVQMAVLVVSSTLYMRAVDGSADTHGLNWIFRICKYLRAVGFLQVAFYLFIYENFHQIAVTAREKEMHDAGLADGMNFSHRSLGKNFIDYLMVPFVAPIYGAIPSIQAQLCHFWTSDLVYTVSKKATRQRVTSVAVEEMA
ncbi:hypothetical protein SEPCBS119000_004602 [Sporothrix epigloea]|uniref:Glycosyltransferase 2-like domain-containing protein n=1 Tax=Sporothrix epigloea TaxID=1892477 RepID=A0ABP0DT27_9PEZI